MNDPRALSRRVAAAGNLRGAIRTLLLDLDGTLAPLATIPEDVHVLPGSLAALARIASSDWRVAVISGRPWRDARRLVAVPGVLIFGSHGAENEDGSLTVRIAEELTRTIDAIAREGKTLAASFAGAWVERKPAAVAFHDRAMTPERRRLWVAERDTWIDSLNLTGIERLPGNCVLELRAAGASKGHVACRFVKSAARTSVDESLVAVGDDLTDEQLFEVVAGHGLTIRVGLEPRESKAECGLASPYEVEEFLEEIAAITVNHHYGDQREAQ